MITQTMIGRFESDILRRENDFACDEDFMQTLLWGSSQDFSRLHQNVHVVKTDFAVKEISGALKNEFDDRMYEGVDKAAFLETPAGKDMQNELGSIDWQKEAENMIKEWAHIHPERMAFTKDYIIWQEED